MVTDSGLGRVHVFAAGKHQGFLGEHLLLRPVGIACDSARQRVFITDTRLQTVVGLDASGTPLPQWQPARDPGLELNLPTAVAVTPKGQVAVVDSLNCRVIIYSETGAVLRVLGRCGDLPGEFALPKGLALAPDGSVLVSDALYSHVQLFPADGSDPIVFGREGSAPGEFALPAGIEVDTEGRIFVADTGNARVQLFRLEPTEGP